MPDDKTLKELIEFNIQNKLDSATEAKYKETDAVEAYFYQGQIQAFTEMLSLIKNIK